MNTATSAGMSTTSSRSRAVKGRAIATQTEAMTVAGRAMTTLSSTFDMSIVRTGTGIVFGIHRLLPSREMDAAEM